MIQAITNENRTATISGETFLATEVDIVVTDENDDEVYSVDGVAVADDEFSYTTADMFSAGTYTATVVAKDAEDNESDPKSDTFIVLAEDNTGVAGFVFDTGGSGTVAVMGLNTTDPLANVTVTVDGQTAVTDANGFFHLENVTAGNHVVNFERAGYLGQSFTGGDRVRVVDGSLSTFSIEMDPRVRGDIEVNAYVRDADDNSLVDEVVAQIGDYDDFLEDYITATDDFNEEIVWDSGNAQFLNFATEYLLTAAVPYHLTPGAAYHGAEQMFTTAADAHVNQAPAFNLDAVEEMTLTVEVTDNR